jgi:hypothetical protein
LPLFVALLTAATLATQVHAQQLGNLPSVRLEPHDGKTTFYLGEPIRLDLVFENRTGAPFTLNTTGYGDLSEKVEITPAEGWFQWQTQSGHDYATVTNLTEKPMSLPVLLDEGFIFRKPGEYKVRVTTARLSHGRALESSSLPPITTNLVTIELRTMPDEVEAAKLATIRADLLNAPDAPNCDELVRDAMHRLAALQGDAALVEKIKMLKSGDDDFRSVLGEAFSATRDLHKQLEQLEQAWNDPAVEPMWPTLGALDTTRLLLAGKNLSGWQMVIAPNKPDAIEQRLADEHHADMVALLNSMPLRTGDSRASAAYYLVGFNGFTDAQHARALDYAIEEFPHMDDTTQDMLIEQKNSPLRTPRLLPALRAKLAANPSDTYVTAALLEIAPADSKQWIVQSICDPSNAVLLDTFKDAKVDRVPEVDACLTPLLRVPPSPSDGRAEFNWQQRAIEAARFANPAILPALREGWKNSRQDSAVLAVFIRNDPKGAVALLNKQLAAGTFRGDSFFSTSNVYKQVAEPFHTEVLTWLRVRLEDGTDNEASTAAYALSIGGDNSDKARVQQRLELIRAQWQGKQLPAEEQQAEMNLASTLGSYESKLFLDEAQRRQLGQGCLTDQCRLYLH